MMAVGIPGGGYKWPKPLILRVVWSIRLKKGFSPVKMICRVVFLQGACSVSGPLHVLHNLL